MIFIIIIIITTTIIIIITTTIILIIVNNKQTKQLFTRVHSLHPDVGVQGKIKRKQPALW